MADWGGLSGFSASSLKWVLHEVFKREVTLGGSVAHIRWMNSPYAISLSSPFVGVAAGSGQQLSMGRGTISMLIVSWPTALCREFTHDNLIWMRSFGLLVVMDVS